MIKLIKGKVQMKGDVNDIAVEVLLALKMLLTDVIPERCPGSRDPMTRAVFATMQDMLRKKCGIDIEIRLDGEVLK